MAPREDLECDAVDMGNLNARLILGVGERTAPVVVDLFRYEVEVVRGAAEVLAQREVGVRRQVLKSGLYAVKGVAAAGGRKGGNEVAEVLNCLVTYSQFVAHP